MTPPPAATAAAKSKPARRSDTPSRPAGSQKRTRPQATTRRAAGTARARPAARVRSGASRSSKGLPRARRISGPARASAAAQRALPQLRPLPVLGAIGSHAAKAGRSLPDSPLLDRLLRGRVWIGLLGVLLIGLVALNVSLLKLNAQAGRNAETAKALRVQNADLRARVSRLRSSDRLQRAGLELGLEMPAAGQVRYLSARPGDGRRAARAVRSGGLLAAEFEPPPLVVEETAPVALAPAAPAVPAVPTGTTGPVVTQPAVPQPAPGPPAGGAAQPPATTAPVTTQPTSTPGG